MTTRTPEQLLDENADLLGHPLEVAGVRDETADARSITFTVPETLADDYRYREGQFVTLAIPSDRTGWVARCYSISSSPAAGELTITVKRTEEGYASNWLCDNVAAGDRLRVLAPGGLFTPRSPEADLLLCAAGSGITPVMSILRAVLGSITGRVALLYVNRDRASAIFADELDALAREHPDRLVVEHWFTSERGRLDAASFAQLAAPYAEREVYTCGPVEFMQAVRDGMALAGFDTARIKSEEYLSLNGDPFEPIRELTAESLSDASSVEVLLDDKVFTLAWPSTYTLVDAMVASGIDTPYACREGKCGACTCELADGEVDLGRTDALEPEDIADGYILGCQATPRSKSLRIEF